MSLYLLYSAFEAEPSPGGTHDQFINKIGSLGAPPLRNLRLFDHVLFGQDGISYLNSIVS